MHPELLIDVAPAYELVLGLSSMSRPDAYEAWTGRVGSEVPAGLHHAIERLSGDSDKVFAHLIPLAYECPPPRDVAAFLDFLEGVDAGHILLHLLGYHLRYFRRATPAETIRRAATGDLEARRELLRTSYPDDVPWQEALRGLLVHDAGTVKSELLGCLREWNEAVFARHESEIMPILRRDAERKEVLRNERAPEAVIEIATQGIEYAPEPGISRVLLIPSFVIRPWAHTVDHGDLKIFCYPVAEESISADPDAPSARLVSLTRALGDERRLRILRLLAGGRYTLPEIAGHLRVPKTTAHHHLLLLRSAGLVRVRSSDRTYLLRPAAIPEVANLLETYLQESPQPGGAPQSGRAGPTGEGPADEGPTPLR
jgi:DNA-binding transcriptional ArsR family regulator